MALSDIAARQEGLVTRQQLYAVGIGKGAVQHRIAVRSLRRIHAGVFAVGHQRLTARGRHRAALLACGDDAVLSHWSGAAASDLCRWPATVQVTVPSRYHRHLPGVLVHGTRSLADHEVIERDGLPCTSVARTLVDLAAVTTSVELQRVLEQSVRLNLFDRNALERYHGRRGMARLRQLIAELPDEAPLTRRELEHLFLDLVREVCLPQPVVNARIGNHEVDFHWPDRMLVVETDGHAFHNDPVAFRRDRRRDLDLELGGWHVLRFGWHDVVHDSGRVVALLRRCLTTD